MKYRKKPVVIEAIQAKENTLDAIKSFVPKDLLLEDTGKTVLFYILTLEGYMAVKNGDYILKGVNGEFYPCKEDIFLKTYEKV
jgi:hypothetical protein